LPQVTLPQITLPQSIQRGPRHTPGRGEIVG